MIAKNGQLLEQGCLLCLCCPQRSGLLLLPMSNGRRTAVAAGVLQVTAPQAFKPLLRQKGGRGRPPSRSTWLALD